MSFVVGTNLETCECYNCNMLFAMTKEFYDRRLKDHESFYCPKGHSQQFIGKSTEQKLREELELKRAEADRLRARNAEQVVLIQQKDRAAKRLKKRIGAGVCPCCKRTVSQMAKHMKTKHPEYSI